MDGWMKIRIFREMQRHNGMIFTNIKLSCTLTSSTFSPSFRFSNQNQICVHKANALQNSKYFTSFIWW